MPCLTLLGTASIQEYVFRSSRLRENLGASDLVRHAMRCWSDHPAKIYVGGGNAALYFDSKDEAKEAIHDWSAQMLKVAPGLRLVVAHQPFKESGLAEAFDAAQEKLALEENAPPLGFELGALPVIRTCPSNGLAASERAKPINKLQESDQEIEDVEDIESREDLPENTWLSAESQAKREFFWTHTRRGLSHRYRASLRTNDGTHYLFPRDLDRLGTVEGASQIAIVHADGNGIGHKLRLLVERYKGRHDQEFLVALRSLSGRLTNLAENAFRHLIEELVSRSPDVKEEVRPSNNGAKIYLPLRPIIDDGDDLTFVCHGRLGLPLAVRYLELFEKEAKKIFGEERYTASAGVLIMPQKFPFAQGYSLAEQVCGNAKAERRTRNSEDAWVDFQILMEGRAGDLETIRGCQYRSRLFNRPYCVGNGPTNRWSVFQTTWREVKAWPRSVAKRVYHAYASGPAAVDSLLKNLEFKLPSGVSSGEAYDALEMLDFHLDFEKLREER